MKTSIVCLLSVAFAIQAVAAQKRRKTDITIMIEENPDFNTLTPVAQDTVTSVINHITYLFREENSAKTLIKIAQDFEEVMTSREGQENIMSLLNLVGFVLKDENASKIISLLCDQASALVMTENGRKVVRQFIFNLKSVLELDNTPLAADAFLKGINKYLITLNPEELVSGLNLVRGLIRKFVLGDESSEDVSLQARQIYGQEGGA